MAINDCLIVSDVTLIPDSSIEYPLDFLPPSIRFLPWKMYDCLLALHGAFQQPHFRGDLGSGVIFGSDKNLEIPVGYRVFKLAFELIVYLQHSSILRIFFPSLGSPPRREGVRAPRF